MSATYTGAAYICILLAANWSRKPVRHVRWRVSATFFTLYLDIHASANAAFKALSDILSFRTILVILEILFSKLHHNYPLRSHFNLHFTEHRTQMYSLTGGCPTADALTCQQLKMQEQTADTRYKAGLILCVCGCVCMSASRGDIMESGPAAAPSWEGLCD